MVCAVGRGALLHVHIAEMNMGWVNLIEIEKNCMFSRPMVNLWVGSGSEKVAHVNLWYT